MNDWESSPGVCLGALFLWVVEREGGRDGRQAGQLHVRAGGGRFAGSY